jgi:RNA polymerase sigma-70 factor (ECF subfamily)
LHAFVSRRVKDRNEVDDLVQEACARLITKTQDSELQNPQAYLFKIAANLIIDLKRKKISSPACFVLLDEESGSVTAPTQEDHRRYVDLQFLFQSALNELPPRCREVFVLRRFDELDTNQIAKRMNISPRMVQKHMTNALAHLYVRLRPMKESGR